MSEIPSIPLPPPQARFTDLGNGTLVELMSNQVQFFYDPTTQASRAIFNGMPYQDIGGKYFGMAATADILEVDFTSQMTRQYANEVPIPIKDPVTGVDLADVSVAGVMVLIKVAYDVEINARETRRLAKLAVASARALAGDAVENAAENGTTCHFMATANALKVTFTNQSVGGTGLTIASRTWIFGDEYGTVTTTSPVYTYAKPGTYDVTLVVTDSAGVKVKSTQSITVPAVVAPG